MIRHDAFPQMVMAARCGVANIAEGTSRHSTSIETEIKEYTEMCDKHSVEAVDDYMELHDDLDDFEEAYCGEWDSEEDFARHIVEECYDLELKIAEDL